jgi:transposase-like protein
MTCHNNNSNINAAIELITENGLDDLGGAVPILIGHAMELQRREHLNANPYERSTERTGYANGFKPKSIKTRVGKLELKVPQVWDSSFYPDAIDRGMRSERALKLAVAEMYVQGVARRAM